MKIFIDSANPDEIKKWRDMGVIDGVTTNPSILLKDTVDDMEVSAKGIARLVYPLPVSLEVTTNKLEEMISQAISFSSWASNIVIKIPQETVIGTPCYGVMKRLESSGIKVNATVALSLGQVILSAKAGATYISIFAGRVGDEGGNAPELIRNACSWLEWWEFKSEIIVGSIRQVSDIYEAALAGAHIITIPPQFLSKMADHQNTRATVKQFTDDAQKAVKVAAPR